MANLDVVCVCVPVADLTTFQLTLAAVCLLGIFILCCLGCLNSSGVERLRRYNVWMETLTRDEQECDHNRVRKKHLSSEEK